MRRIVLALLAVSALLLAGCTTTGRSDAAAGNGWKYYGVAGGTDSGTETGTDTGTDAGTDAVADGVGFDEALADGATVEWTDAMFADADFTVDSPDDGNGRWSYAQVSTGCRISFWQTRAEGIGAAGDERARSDEMLAIYLDFEPSDVEEYVFETPVAIAFTDGAVFDARALVGSGETEDWMTLARVFDGPDVGIALDITCPVGTDAESALTALIPDFVSARIS